MGQWLWLSWQNSRFWDQKYQLETIHQQKNSMNIFLSTVEKIKIKKKESENGPSKKHFQNVF